MSPRRPLYGLVDLTDHFRRLPISTIPGFAFLASALVARTWDNIWAGVIFGLLALSDGVMLVALPRFDRSFGPPQLPWLSLIFLRLGLALIAAWGPSPWAIAVGGLAQLGVTLSATYACWVEPTRLGLTQITLRSPWLNGCPPLRLLHISDLHIERITTRERRLLESVARLAPDLIVITGDLLNISYTNDVQARRQTRELLRQLQSPRGVYAIVGSPSVDPPHVVAQLLDGLDVVWLRDEIAVLEWYGCRLRIVGVECSYDVDSDGRKLRHLLDGGAANGFTLLLYHTPDVMPIAAELGVDLYLAGHTHGGQLRLPLFGALVTASIHGKRYEMGAYRERNTVLYVSRGLGMEGKGAPRARFLCPPEVIQFTLLGAQD